MLPPLNRKLALDLIAGTRLSRVLVAYRNLPAVDMDALTNMLLQVSAMCCELPWLAEMDLNPVLAHAKGAIVADARVVIDPKREIEPQRYRHMAIHPYPAHLEQEVALRDGTALRLRPIRPEDAEMEHTFVTELSEQSRYLRFLHTLPQLTPRMLARFTQIDYDTELALIALHEEDGKEKMAGVARYVPQPDGESAEYAVAIADDWQRRGLGTLMLTRLLECARHNGLRRIEGTVLAVNQGMLRVVSALGFTLFTDPNTPEEIQVYKDLA
jgi:acetyltransferase